MSEDFFLPVGHEFAVTHFSIGQKVDLSAISIGKGFAGAMKRHHFGGLRASHGVSISARSHGSTGQCQDPGRVFKNKKMAGHMGSRVVSQRNTKILEINESQRVVVVKCGAPGWSGGWVQAERELGKLVLPRLA